MEKTQTGFLPRIVSHFVFHSFALIVILLSRFFCPAFDAFLGGGVGGGVQIFNSYGQGYRLTGEAAYVDTILTGAETLYNLRYEVGG